MAEPQKPVLLGAKSSTLAASTIKIYVNFRNLTHGGIKRVAFDSNGEAILDTPYADWEVGDVISIEVYGKYNKATSETLTKGGISADLGSLTEDTSTVAVNL